MRSTWFFLSCGALVRSKEPRQQIIQFAKRCAVCVSLREHNSLVFGSYDINEVFGFGASSFFPEEVNPFVVAYVTVAVLPSNPANNYMKTLLKFSTVLGRHTEVLQILDFGKKCLQWVWHKPSVCPWGVCLPWQCENCKALRSLRLCNRRPNSLAARKHAYICLGEGCGRRTYREAPGTKPMIEVDTGFGTWHAYDIED